MRLLLLIAAFVAVALASGRNAPMKKAASHPATFMLVAPSKIRPGVVCPISVNVPGAKRPVNVTADLLEGRDRVVTTKTGQFQANNPGSLVLRVPHDLVNSRYRLRVIGSGGLDFNETTSIGFDIKQMSILVQTDKALYKPGETIKFRVVPINPDLTPYNGPIDITIQDASSNNIRQFMREKPVMGVITKSLSLSPQPVLGDWKIIAKTKGTSQSKIVTIAEYVLPKFKVDVEMPSFVVESDKSVSFKVKASYTYGKPVKGHLKASVKLHYQYEDFDSSRDLPIFTTDIDIDGEAIVKLHMKDAKKVNKYLSGRKFSVQAEVTESLTGNTRKGSGSVDIYSSPYKIQFVDSNPTTFKPGLEYVAFLKISLQDGLPVPSKSLKQVHIALKTEHIKDPLKFSGYNLWEPFPYHYPDIVHSKSSLVVPKSGLVKVKVTLQSNATKLNIYAAYDKVQASTTVDKMYSPSLSYLEVKLRSPTQPGSGSDLQFSVKSTQPMGPLVYQVLSRGEIVKIGSVDGNGVHEGEINFKAEPRMAPNARIIVYYITKEGEVVTDSISFDVDGIFKNQVSIEVDKNSTQPGQTVKFTVKADPLSHAHILAVDQSVLLLKSGNDITTKDVYSELQTYDTISEITDSVFRPFGMRRDKRSIWWPYPLSYGGSDAKSVFKKSGVIVLTDALVFKHKEPMRPIVSFGNKKSQVEITTTLNPDLKLPETIRQHFPETWLWSSHLIDSDGVGTIETKVPDTITSWVATGFAINNNTGLGIASTPVEVNVYKPFFVTLSLPYSVVRGEIVTLQANVFNYLNTDQDVTVRLSKSDQFDMIEVDAYGNEIAGQKADAIYNIPVKSNEAESVFLPILPSELGHIDITVTAQGSRAADALTRQLLVEPEGVSKEYNIPVLVELDSNSKKSFLKTVEFNHPENIVAGSEMLTISVIGDIMGPSISGLDKLIRMPTGCGEQNMLGMAPIAYIYKYLKSTNQMTRETETKAISFMEKGYQRELTYKHKDGSFSAFGESDKSGSMWLTAFVARVFHQAKDHTYIDENVLRTAISWMIKKQDRTGMFPEPGRIIHKSMQGKAASGSSLTTFVLLSLLENQDLYTKDNKEATLYKQAISKAFSYLSKEIQFSDDIYLLTMASYAYQLANRRGTENLLKKVMSKASTKDGLSYWHQEPTKKNNVGSWHSPNPTSAVDTEMTSYVLMTYALRRDLAEGRKIVQWLMKQRNPNGGFSSTQDTVVALNGLYMMAQQLYKNDAFELDVTVSFENKKYSFTVSKTNSAIMQRQMISKIPQNAVVTATGLGTALVDMAVSFNVEREVEDTTFDLKVNLLNESINKLEVETCTSWRGSEKASGMAVQEIGIPSGFEADLESFPKLETLKRKETEGKKVILYFDEIGEKEVCVKFVAERTSLVAKSKPAVIRVYDYYEPSNQVTAFYQSQVLGSTKLVKSANNAVKLVAK